MNKQQPGLQEYKIDGRLVSKEEFDAAAKDAMPEPIMASPLREPAHETWIERHAATQAFFASLADEMRKPHFGEHAKQFTRNLLIRAEEADLYHPQETK